MVKTDEFSDKSNKRAENLFHEQKQRVYIRTDRFFALLMVIQWVGAIITALIISPRAWAGTFSETHIHVWVALILGGLITSLPVFLALTRPGHTSTRHVVAIGQMLMSALLIHLTGGRIETHFHIFGSLAFLSFYRDWRVLITASAVVAIDHAIRGIFWPQSVYGVLAIEPWRWVEHVFWVVFEDVFLIISIAKSTQEMWTLVKRQAELESTHALIEMKVEERTFLLKSEVQQRVLPPG